MKMNGFMVILVLGLVVCGCLVYRHQHRTPPSAVPAVMHPADSLRPVNAWQESIKLTPAVKLDWREQLRREEGKQRPQEGRN